MPSQPDHAGVQADRSREAPEVVQHAPEVVPWTLPWAPIERHSSRNKPEAYAIRERPASSLSPEVLGSDEKQVCGPDYAGNGGSGQRRRRTRDMRRRTSTCIAIATGILVVIAVVLGAVLGTVLPSGQDKESKPLTSSNQIASSPSISSNTGLAALYPSGSSTLLLYYQDEQGRVIENRLAAGVWSINDSDVPQNALVTTDAQSGSPLAAISWSPSGSVQGQVFYFDTHDRLMQVNTTANQPWSVPYEIVEADQAAPGNMALCPTVGTMPAGTGFDGIRIYYGSSYINDIQEVGLDFFESEQNIWHAYASFEGSDVRSGIGCAYDNNVTNAFSRNLSAGMVEQWSWNYYDHFLLGAQSWNRTTMQRKMVHTQSVTDFAAAADGDGTAYLFFQDYSGGLFRALGTGAGLDNIVPFGSAASGTRLTAAYGDLGMGDGAVVFFRQPNETTWIGYAQMSRSGEELVSGTLG